MAHSHSHAHHHPSGPDNETAVGRAFVLIAGFMVVEVLGGLLANSLTLLADAGHMLLDATALGLSWYSLKLSRRAQDQRLSYGYHRYQVLAAFINGLLLLGLIAWILTEAYERFSAPQQMLPLPALTVALIGLVVNVIAFRWLHHTQDNAAVRSAALHVIGDILGSGAAIAAALIYYFTGWPYVDPLLALVVVAILARGAWRVLSESAHILLEGVPHGINLREIAEALTQRIPEVRNVHHLHAWALTAEKPLLTLHANVEENVELGGVVTRMKAVLNDEFGIDHSTIQVEHGPCPDD